MNEELARIVSSAESPAVAVADWLIKAALERRASDLHVDPERDHYVLRLRLDGVLQRLATLERERVPTLVARFKVLANLPTYVVDRAQDGRIPRDRFGCEADMRLATLPTVHGERAVVRLFEHSEALLEFVALGLPDAARDALERAILAPRGVILLAGPAGSGKSTTIHAALRRILEASGGRRSVVGIEDPVERVLPGVTQAEVDLARGFGFAEALQAVLRQDPEVIYVGEVRDQRTATCAIEAGLTGHLVITTVHAGSCAQVFSRLVDMGIEPHMLTSAVSAVFAQRLLRRLCAACAEDGSPRGCQTCLDTGYRGRVPVVEHVVPDRALRDAVLRGADEDGLTEVLKTAGVTSLQAAAQARVASGETTQAELERVLGRM